MPITRNPLLRHPHALAVIQEQKVRPERGSQRQGGSFSLIEVAERIIERTLEIRVQF